MDTGWFVNVFTAILRILVVGLLITACAGQPLQAGFEEAQEPGQNQPEAVPAEKSIGTIELVQKSIFHNQAEVEQIENLFANDSLFVEGGGEGILELLDNLRLRIFNTTRLGGITIKNEPGTPLFIRIFLELGGFTGEFAALDGELDFETPGGALIRVKGTNFLVVYDGDSRTTIAGNFEGSMTFESAGSGPVEIKPGTMRRAQAGSPPGPERPIPFTQIEYEGRARELQSPVEPLNLPGDVVALPQGDTPQSPPAQGVTPQSPPPQDVTQSPEQISPSNSLPPTAEVIQNAFCRTGPSQVFEAEDSFLVGVRLDVDGRLADSTWWRVITPDGRKSCWISSILISLSGDLDGVPVLPSPPTPTPQPSPTPTSTPSMPVDSFGPQFDSVYADPDPVNEGVNCPESPYYTQLYVYASDPSGVVGVSAEWVIESDQGSVGLEQVDDTTFTGTIGPFYSSGDLLIFITAWDTLENYSSTDLAVYVYYQCLE